MFGFIEAVVGAILAAFGFLVLWNPMQLAMLARGVRGYYQRVMLDTSSRNQIRVLGEIRTI